jgi:hypothetical protein
MSVLSLRHKMLSSLRAGWQMRSVVVLWCTPFLLLPLLVVVRTPVRTVHCAHL